MQKDNCVTNFGVDNTHFALLMGKFYV